MSLIIVENSTRKLMQMLHSDRLSSNKVRSSKLTIQLLIIKHHPDIAKLLGTLLSVKVETFLQPIYNPIYARDRYPDFLQLYAGIFILLQLMQIARQNVFLYSSMTFNENSAKKTADYIIYHLLLKP